MAKREGSDIVSDAVNDAKAIKNAALSAAKNELVESLAPALKTLLEKHIKGALSQNEDSDRMRRGIQDKWPGESHTGFEEAVTKEGEDKMEKDLDLESIASFFPPVTEGDDADADDVKVEDASIPTLGEAEGDDEMKEGKKKKKDKEDVNEEIEISESELRKVYEAALQTEVQVKKGFSDMTPMGELEDVVKDTGKGLNPENKSEKMWGEKGAADLEAHQDFTVKEMRTLIQKGLSENKHLRDNIKKAVGLVRQLGEKLHEVNLFNSKVLHVNRILNKNGSLTTEQKRVVLESIDKAKTIDQVRMVYEAITNSFDVSHRISESRKPNANSQRARTTGTPDKKVLGESVDRENNVTADRWSVLAGLVK